MIYTPIVSLLTLVAMPLGYGDSLTNRIHVLDKRYSTFRLALDLMAQRHVKTIVETGTARGGDTNCVGDGCSTPIWAQWAKHLMPLSGP